MKKEELATYSYKAIAECVEVVKAIPQTTRYKSSHFAVAGKIDEVYKFCFDKTGCYSFYPYDNYNTDYMNAAYRYDCFTGKELNEKKNHAIRFLQNELNGIYAMMRTGEVNAIA